MQPNLKRLGRPVRPLAWTAGVDWFRYILDGTIDSRPDRERAEDIQQRDRSNGSKLQRWSFQGYRGWQTDSIRWGERNGELLWESSGETAASTMARMGSSGGYASRIDLQTTLRLSHSRVGFGTSVLGCSPETIRHHRYRRTQYGLSQSSTGLWLGTVGRRTSRSYLRIYDKGVEAKCAPPGFLWRIELECKHEHSRTLSCKHLDSLTDPAWCAAYLEQQSKSLGCLWPLEPFAGTAPDVHIVPPEPTNAWKLAKWLRATVAPTMPRVLTVFTVAEVLEMLELSAVACPSRRADVARGPTRHVPDERS